MIRKLKLLGLALIVLIALATNCFAFTEYYVDFANGVDGGANNGTTEALAWKTLQYALDTATAAAGGTRINVEYDDATYTQTLTATIDVDTNTGTSDNPIIVQGYSVTVGDGARAVIDANSAAVSCFDGADVADFIIFKDLECKGATGTAFTTASSDNCLLENIKITTAGTVGITIAASDSNNKIINCEITGTTTFGFDISSAIDILFCYIHDTTTTGMDFGTIGSHIIGCIIDTTAHGIDIGGGSDNTVLIGNTIYNAVGAGKDNVSLTTAGDEKIILINNILNTAADDSLDLLAGSNIWFYANNVIVTKNVDGAILFSSGESTLNPQFEGAATGDFNIGVNMDNLAYPNSAGSFPGSTTTQDNEPGAMAYEETAGGGGGGWVDW